MELKVNLLNEMTKYRKGYFTSTESILDELVQNAQRAKATSITLKFDPTANRIEVKDDGCGCDDINALITKSQSGWSAATVAAESPAGEGMYSVCMIANKLEFVSKASCKFNFDKIFDTTPSLDIVELTSTTIPKGSFLIISDIIENYTLAEIFNNWCAHAKQSLKFSNVDIILTFNDTTVKTGNLLNKYITEHLQKSHINTVIENDDYLFIYDSAENNTVIELYYQNRFVRPMHSGYLGVGGVLIIKNNDVIGVRLPDRKDTVSDKRFENLRYELGCAIMKHLSQFTYEDINDSMDTLFACIGNNFYNRLKNEDFQFVAELKWIYSHKRKTTISGAEFLEELIELGEQATVYGINRYGYQKPSEAVIANNIYYGREIYEFGHGFYGFVSELYKVVRSFAHPLFRGHSKPFKIGSSMGTSPLIGELINLTNYIFNDVAYNRLTWEQNDYHPTLVVKPSWEVAEVTECEFTGLCIHAENRILLNWNYLKVYKIIKTKKEAREFIINNSEVILHEIAHFIFRTEDRTVEHAEAQIKLYGIFINYLLK
jgi:hypothetical protein